MALLKCAERVGVSHTAPKNHFGNMAGLLTAMVTRGYEELAAMMSAQTSGDANHDQRRQDALLGYVNFAERNPALYELMFSRDRLVNDDPALLEEIRTFFMILADASEDLSWHQSTADQKTGKGQVALWSFVHGHAQLITAQRLKKDNMQDLSILDILPAIRPESEG